MKNAYDEAIERLQKEIVELERKSKEHEAKKIPLEIKGCAEMLHKSLCHGNHTDQCDWFYDDGSWSAWSRRKYIDVAKRLLSITDMNTIKLVMEVIKKYV